MADNTQVPGGTGDVIRDKDRAGVKTQIVGLDLNPAGAETLMTGALPVSGTVAVSNLPATQPVSLAVAPSTPVTGTFFQATQPVSGTVAVSNPTTNPETGLAKDATLTGGTQKTIARGGAKGTTAAADLTSNPVDANTQALHATLVGTQATVPVTGTFFQGTQPVSLAANTPDVTDRAARLLGHVTVDAAPSTAVTGPLTDTQLRATAVPVSGTVTANAGTGTLAVSGPVTDTQIRATPLPVSGTVTANAGTGTLAVSNTAFPAAAALADAKANPTTTMVADGAMVFNGTTWDRLHGNWRTTTGDVGAQTVSFTGATQTNYDAVGAVITILLTTVSGTTPTLSAQLQYSIDGGTIWLPLGAVLPNLTATGQSGTIAVLPVAMAAGMYGATVSVLTTGFLPRTWRLNYTIAGTTPSFTFSFVAVNYVGGA